MTAVRAVAQEREYSAVGVKAAFLFHFGSYVEWPQSASTSAPLTIGVIGDEPVAAELQRILPGRTIQNRPVRIRRLSSIDALTDEQILYIGAAGAKQLPRSIPIVEQRHVLLVTESQANRVDSAAINFVLVDRRVRFEISLDAAKRAGLSLSSRLLAIALRVEKSGWLYRLPSLYAADHLRRHRLKAS